MDRFLIDAQLYIIAGDLIVELDISGYIFIINDPGSEFPDINYN